MEVDRIGIDIDDHDGLKYLITSLRAKWFGSVRDFYTNHGFHIDIDLPSEMDAVDSLNIRRLLGDCPDRIRIDEERLNGGADVDRYDTLFEVRLKNGETYSRREIRPLACGPFPRQEEGYPSLGFPEDRQGQEVYSG